MSSLFITILNMSITASYVALAVILARLLMKKAPRIFSYVLWAVVLFRLLSPFTFESPLSLLHINTQPFSHNIIYSENPAIASGIGIADKALNQSFQSSLPPVNPAASVNPIRIVLEIGAIIWILGIIILLCYGVISYCKLMHKLSTATLVHDNIYETDRIKTPFVLGLIKPRIYIPINLAKSELGYIIKHEQTHIRRHDYIIKPIAFLALTIHWFNPLIWFSYFLMVKDMELSCDESVMKQSSDDIRVNYSNSLLALSAKQSGLVTPLAFGESSAKSRIKNVLNYRKPAFWVIVAAVLAVITVAIGLMVNPIEADTAEADTTEASTTGADTVENNANPDQITSFALETIKRDIENYETNPEIKIIDSKITRLELIESFDSLAETPIDVYALEYRILPEDISKVAIAGGMQIDEDGWLKETCSMGSPLLVVTRKTGSVELIGTLWTGGVSEEGGLESSIKALLQRINENEGKTSDNNTNIDNQKDIDNLLSTIMSSPATSSATGDYIKAHQKECDEIILMGEAALPYFIEILDSGDSGLRGNIVVLLCENITKNLSENQKVSSETEKLIKEASASINNWNDMMGYDLSLKASPFSPVR